MRSLVVMALSVAGWSGAQAGKGRVVSGVLSSPSATKPELVARKFLAQAPDLLRVPMGELTAPWVEHAANGAGFIVRYRQTHPGVPVIGGGAVVRVDGEGRVVRAGASTIDVGAIDVRPTVS